uniref:Phospholipid/glycerol acyltransferase domain-containing protein n=1 Tax=Ditylenchus dipsaci TaxID=166011 RepID=A0A915E1X2_9BILA
MLLLASTEHFIVLTAFLFPPLLLTVILVIVLASFGKSLGLRERYVNCLIRIFEWGAGEIRTTQLSRKQSRMFDVGDDCSEDETDFVLPERGEYCSLYSETINDSGIQSGSPFMARSLSSVSSFRKHYHGSATSLGSASSIRMRERHGSGQSIIVRETAIHLDEDDYLQSTVVNSRGWQVMKDSLYFMKAGVEAIIEDEDKHLFYQFVNWKLTLLWGAGFLFRYLFLLPLRIILFSIGLIFLLLSTAVIGIISRSVSALVYFHDQENKAQNGGICVANHTSPIDVMILSTDNIYALIGQRHSAVLGFLQRALSRASSHIWFERSEARDRAHVTSVLKEHVEDPHKLPILVFPEGGTKIYPIAMKYDSRFGDAFWNSSEQSWVGYIMQMMTSWAIICHVWYLPPMEKLSGESAIDFANRVKKTIAIRGGLVDLEWDGQLKRSKVPVKLLAKQQEKYYQRYSRYTSFCEPPSFKDSEDSHSEIHSEEEYPCDVTAELEEVFEEDEEIEDKTTVA